MTHLDIELQELKAETIKMWILVRLQLKKAKEAWLKSDKDLAREVVLNERRVNAYELKIDRDCENIFALFNPVAVDLRYVLAVLKINSNLERIGDNAESIAKFVINVDNPFNNKLLEITRVLEMYDEATTMLDETLEAFEKEDSRLARAVFKRDEVLNEINHNAHAIIEDYIRQNPIEMEQCLYVLSIIRKLERVGDQSKNIAEEIIFYIEAKVLKHLYKVDKDIQAESI